MSRFSLGVLVLSVICLASAAVVLAGTGFDLTCTNKDCGYKGNAQFGGGRQFEQISGFCVRDNQFVYVRWKRSDKAPAPLKIWNPTDGTFVELYKCPTCGDPFLPIKTVEDVKYCPKCNRPTLESKRVVAYD
jgi:DNA-directed RNA polymerase subunit RPC12/RpoP